MLGVDSTTWLERRMLFLLFTLSLLNVCDALLTQMWMTLGVIEEANPLMAYLLEVDVWAFYAIKVVLVALGGSLLWFYKSQRSAQLAAVSLVIVYVWVMKLHYDVWVLVQRFGAF